MQMSKLNMLPSNKTIYLIIITGGLELQPDEIGITIDNFDKTVAIKSDVFVVNLVFEQFALDCEHLGVEVFGTLEGLEGFFITDIDSDTDVGKVPTFVPMPAHVVVSSQRFLHVDEHLYRWVIFILVRVSQNDARSQVPKHLFVSDLVH
jgi:hypothetical protein